MEWGKVQQPLANAAGAIQARDAALQGSGTTLEIAILEAIVRLDSAQTSAVETLGAGGMLVFSDDGRVRPGELQQLDALEATFFGSSDGAPGLLDTIRGMRSPALMSGSTDAR